MPAPQGIVDERKAIADDINRERSRRIEERARGLMKSVNGRMRNQLKPYALDQLAKTYAVHAGPTNSESAPTLGQLVIGMHDFEGASTLQASFTLSALARALNSDRDVDGAASPWPIQVSVDDFTAGPPQAITATVRVGVDYKAVEVHGAAYSQPRRVAYQPNF